MTDKQTIGVYDDKAQDYARINKSDGPGRILNRFITALPKGGLVLDLGCGPGLDARPMMDAGLRVEALDASPAMVELALSQGVNARLGTFSDLTAQARYDGIWASFSLLHAPRADMPAHLAAIKRALKPGGLLELAVKTGTGEARDKLGRFYTYYMPDELTGLLDAAGLTTQEITKGRDTGLDGAPSDWVSVAAHG